MSLTGRQWAVDLLLRMGAMVALPNVRFLVAWAAGENTRARFNPLATTRSAFGGYGVGALGAGESNFNSVGVKNFASYELGLVATVATIENGNFPTIHAGLRAGAAIGFTAVVLHELDLWGTGGTRVAGIDNTGVDLLWVPPSLVDVTETPLPPAPPAPPRETSMVIIVSAEHDTVYAVDNGAWTEIDDTGDAANAMQQLPHFTWSAATIAKVRGAR